MFHYVGQADLKLLTSGDPSALASQSSGITGVSHRAQPYEVILKCIFTKGLLSLLSVAQVNFVF